MQIRSVLIYHVLTYYMGQKEKYDKTLFCPGYGENRHSYTTDTTHKEGHFAISIKNKNAYISFVLRIPFAEISL